ncbi:unnamed protein product [marine sediment metagenome]|uniref:Uncharacterized protein n=1 Tax=marine sediment metagenome TaxID=412755 RepID=X0UDL0_9ZZZZ
MTRTKEQLYRALLKANGIIAEMVRNPPECSDCIQKDEYHTMKDQRIKAMGENMSKYAKENRLVRTFLKEIL